MDAWTIEGNRVGEGERGGDEQSRQGKSVLAASKPNQCVCAAPPTSPTLRPLQPCHSRTKVGVAVKVVVLGRLLAAGGVFLLQRRPAGGNKVRCRGWVSGPNAPGTARPTVALRQHTMSVMAMATSGCTGGGRSRAGRGAGRGASRESGVVAARAMVMVVEFDSVVIRATRPEEQTPLLG